MLGELVFAPPKKKLDADISVPRAVFHPSADKSYPVRLIHFSNYRTQLSFYRNEVIKLENDLGQSNVDYIHKNPRCLALLLRISDVRPFYRRVVRKVKRVLHI